MKGERGKGKGEAGVMADRERFQTLGRSPANPSARLSGVRLPMRTPVRILLALLPVMTALAPSASAQHAPPPSAPDSAKAKVLELEPLTVVGRVDDLLGMAGSASEGHVGVEDLRQRPLLREGQLLETVPGVIVTQHSGDGKANQYFVRGFNVDHGTDFRTSVEGMPVNMPTHAHGQGYTDLSFLNPELVEYVDYRLGVYHAEMGDFGRAGGAEFRLARRLPRPFATTTAGEHNLKRAAGGGSWRVGGGDLLLGGEGKGYDGPWRLGEDLRKFSGMARYSRDRGGSSFSLLVLGYRNRWNATDQIPLRAVRKGTISRFGQIDDSDGAAARGTACPDPGGASAGTRSRRCSSTGSTPT